jgi:hypothetical protein
MPEPRSDPDPEVRPDPADLWRAYELAQQHYEADLQLFSARMNLFLLIQSALVAIAGSGTQIGKGELVASRGAVACFGLALAVGWLLVAGSSYLWVKTWRAHMVQLADGLDTFAHVEVSGRVFDRGRRRDGFKRVYRRHHRLWDQLEYFSWFIRPTLVTCCLPVIFIVGWIYLGWFT